ncbi:SpoIIE family protein phosphatase [candidate division KSB1 bacterium]|nr:SpoIIE family protein phosphatase [candidate division KSB1 bacterium]
MKLLPSKKIFAPVPLLLLCLVIIADFIFGLAGIIVKEFMVLREITLAAAIILGLPYLKKFNWLTSGNIFNRTKILLLSVLGIYLANLFSPDVPFQGKDYFSIFSGPFRLLLATISSISLIFMSILILFMLQELIYVRRKKNTHRNFSFLIFTILIYLGLALIIYYQSERNLNFYRIFEHSVIQTVILPIVILFMVVNSFRNSWINYLNKQQKIKYLFIGIIVLAGWGFFVHGTFSDRVIVYSLVFEIFTRMVGLFLLIYWGMAIIALIFHLPTAGIVDRRVREISSLHALSRTISSEFNQNRLVIKINELAKEVTEANAAWLEILDRRTNYLKLVSYSNLNAKVVEWIDNHPGEGIGNWVLQNRQPLWINELKKNDQAYYLRQLGLPFESLMAVPIIFYDQIVGVLNVVKLHEFGFIPDDLNMLRAFADQAAVALENARLVQESLEKERLAQELKIAHDAQMKLLPKSMPNLKELDIDAVCITAQDVGGDYYDLFLFPDNRLGIVIGDVSGKGSAAAFLMAEVKGIIKSLAHTYVSPREVLIRTNELLYENLERKFFISLIYAVIDLNLMSLTFSRAGHCPLLFGQAQTLEARFIEPKGIGIGLTHGELFNQSLEEHQIALNQGDTFLFYTDGLVEAMNLQKAEFEESRLLQIFTHATYLNSQSIKNTLVKEVYAFMNGASTHDDLTMVVVKVT